MVFTCQKHDIVIKIILLNRNYLNAPQVLFECTSGTNPQKRTKTKTRLSTLVMKKKFVTFSFKKMGYNDYIGKARDIQSGLDGPLFTTIVPTPGEVIPLIDQLQGLWTQTQLGNKIVVPERDALRAAITALLVKQGLAVNYLADGDLSILVQSGFDITKTAEQKDHYKNS